MKKKDFLESVFETMREQVKECEVTHPHDIMGSVLSTAEVLYKFSAKMDWPGNSTFS